MGSLTAIEVRNLNLKRSEQGRDEIVLLSRVLEYIYITNKLRMLEQCITYVDNFLRILNSRMEGAFDIDIKSKHS